LLVIPLILLLFVSGVRSSGTTVALFSAGLSSFSLEIILILTFQILYGYVYFATGILITFFMAGLAPGVFFARRYPKKSTYKSLVLLQVFSSCIILLALTSIHIFNGLLIPTVSVYAIFSILIFSMAMVTGAQFHIATVLKTGNIKQVAASSYSADLVGSAAGALLVNAWIIPFWGLTVSLVVVACINVLAIFFMVVKHNREFLF
jgi:hypothetical protein